MIKKLSQEVNSWYAGYKSDLKGKIQKSILEFAKDSLLSHDIMHLDRLCL